MLLFLVITTQCFIDLEMWGKLKELKEVKMNEDQLGQAELKSRMGFIIILK